MQQILTRGFYLSPSTVSAEEHSRSELGSSSENNREPSAAQLLIVSPRKGSRSQ